MSAGSIEQHPIEMILAKQLASHLATAVFLVDPDGSLLFYNEPAEAILGLRYEETGEMPLDTWGTIFVPTAVEGEALDADDLPLAVALRERRPAHGCIRIRGLDGHDRTITIGAVPIEGHAGRHLGAMAVFTEDET